MWPFKKKCRHVWASGEMEFGATMDIAQFAVQTADIQYFQCAKCGEEAHRIIRLKWVVKTPKEIEEIERKLKAKE